MKKKTSIFKKWKKSLKHFSRKRQNRATVPGEVQTNTLLKPVRTRQMSPLTTKESSRLKARIEELNDDNHTLYDELDKTNESYKMIKAEFAKNDQENSAMHHTIQVLERESAYRKYMSDKYEKKMMLL